MYCGIICNPDAEVILKYLGQLPPCQAIEVELFALQKGMKELEGSRGDVVG